MGYTTANLVLVGMFKMKTNVNDDVDNKSSRAIESITRACGQEFMTKFYDPDVIEIMLNPDGTLWIDTLSSGQSILGKMSKTAAISMIRTVAGINDKYITNESPFLETNFPIDQSRFAAQFPPIVTSPTFALRKRAIKVFSLDDYVENDMITINQATAIKKAVRDHRNILVCGGTGSGKTTLLNAIIAEINILCPEERLIIIEDTPEIQSKAKNTITYRTSAEVSMSDLIKISLRMRPDRILVGEIRGAEALSLLESWNTGHEGGLATVHCNSATDAISRLILMVSKHHEAPRNIEFLINSVVDVIVFIEKGNDGKRRIKEVVALDGYNNDSFNFKSII